MFKKIRIIGISILIILTMLIITIVPALAYSTSNLSSHTIGPYSTVRYWSGSGGCNNNSPFDIAMHQHFLSYVSVYSGYYITSYHRVVTKTDVKYFNWSVSDGPAGLFKFYTQNRNSSTLECSEGWILWSD